MEKQYDITLRELKQQHDELVLKMALLQDAYQTDNDIEASLRDDPEYKAALQQYKERTEPKILAAINTIPMRQRKNKAKWVSFRAVNVAAAILSITFILTASALAWIPAVRHTALQFLISVEKTYTELRLVENPALTFEVPAQWRGEHFPAYLPERFLLYSVDDSEMNPAVEYHDENGKWLTFSEHGDGTGIVIDTENATIEDIVIKGEPGQCATKGNTVRVYWKHDNKFFILVYEGEMHEAIAIAESVEKISK